MQKIVRPPVMLAAGIGLLSGTALLAQSAFFSTAPAYSAVQAARGKTVFEANCANCHGASLAGGQFGPTLRGAAFQSHWVGQSPEALFDFIRTRMPPGAPGSLSGATLADVFAYVMQANGLAPGARDYAPSGAPPVVVDPHQSAAAAAANNRASRFASAAPNYDAAYQRSMDERKTLLDAMRPVNDAMLTEVPEGDWLMWRRNYGAHGFSPLAQVNKANIGALGVEWSRTLQVSNNEITPLVHDGVMFVQSGATVQALDATNGDLLWEYVRPLPDAMANGRNAQSKAVALYGSTLYAPTVDGHIVALDARTGKLLWDKEVLTPDQIAKAVRLNGAPIVVKGKVIMGVTLSLALEGGCWILALDGKTGEEVWRFNTVAKPGEPGGDSWNGVPGNQRFGGSIWTGASYDPALDLIYVGTGNTYDTTTLLRPHEDPGKENAGLFTESTLAIRPDTGKLAWYYQHMNRDVWDMDWAFEQTLVDVPTPQGTRKMVVTGGKLAIFDAVDRADGRYRYSVDAGLQNLVSDIDPKTGEKHIRSEMKPEAGAKKMLCPGAGGLRNWPSTAYNPKSHLLFVPMVDACSEFSWTPRGAGDPVGGIDQSFRMQPKPGNDGLFGRIQAIDLATGKTRWVFRQRAANSSSMLATGGGLIFNGARDRYFSAYDQADGKALWRIRLNAQASASPITYSVKGVQYVAVVAGGGNPQDTQWAPLTPEHTTPNGTTTLWVMRLRGK